MSEGRRGETLPRAAAPFVTFASVLRRNGFPVAPEQTQSFIAGVGLLGPRRMSDIHAAARATLAPIPERFDEFDALFRAHFLGQTLAAPADTLEDERAYEPDDGAAEAITPEEETQSGSEATGAEALAGRAFSELPEAEALRRFRRAAPAGLPRRRSRRMRVHHGGRRPFLRQALREAVRRDGEIFALPRLAPRTAQRRILLLIDVSGSMKSETDRALRFAHTLAHVATRAEIFTVGTRLTRITRPLRHRNRDAALDAAAAAVADWDGGTRLGDALTAFLAVPRFAGFARAAVVVILSDGLERGEPDALIAAVTRLSRLAHSIVWLSPLAQDPSYRPETEALKAVAPLLTRLGNGASTAAVAHEILSLGRDA